MFFLFFYPRPHTGSYNNGSTLYCSFCQDGKVTAQYALGQTECSTVCPPSYGRLFAYDKICTACRPSFFSNGTSLSCYQCGDGLASSAGMSECVVPTILCDDGHYFNGYSCVMCWPNTYCYGGKCLYSCSQCLTSLGFLSSMSGAVSCTSDTTSTCGAGSGKVNWGDYGCYPCPSGYYNNGSSLFCLPHSFQPSSKCPAGFGAATVNDQCLLCPSGTFNNGSSWFCNPCPANLASSKGAYSCISPPLSCRGGQYLVMGDIFGAAVYGGSSWYCAECNYQPNFYANGQSLNYCSPCSPNIHNYLQLRLRTN